MDMSCFVWFGENSLCIVGRRPYTIVIWCWNTLCQETHCWWLDWCTQGGTDGSWGIPQYDGRACGSQDQWTWGTFQTRCQSTSNWSVVLEACCGRTASGVEQQAHSNELTLFRVHQSGQRDVSICGDPDHLQANCPKPKKCKHCGKSGHLNLQANGSWDP